MAFIIPILVLFFYLLGNVLLYKQLFRTIKESKTVRTLDFGKKKYNDVELGNYGKLFFYNALVLSLLFCIAIIEYPTFKDIVKEKVETVLNIEDQIFDIPITEMSPPPPPPKIMTPEIVEVPDDQIIEKKQIEIEQNEDPKPFVPVEIPTITEAVKAEVVDQVLDLSQVQVSPSFPGGVDAMYKYISDNYVYPSRDIEEETQGKVFVQFVVNKKGEVTDVKVARGINDRVNAEAVRVIKNMPNWSPGRNAGVPVSCRYMIPVVLKLK